MGYKVGRRKGPEGTRVHRGRARGGVHGGGSAPVGVHVGGPRDGAGPRLQRAPDPAESREALPSGSRCTASGC